MGVSEIELKGMRMNGMGWEGVLSITFFIKIFNILDLRMQIADFLLILHSQIAGMRGI